MLNYVEVIAELKDKLDALKLIAKLNKFFVSPRKF